MFGTLRIRRDRLDAEQRQAYRAAFCAGCHALHDVGGRSSALLTSYDQAALAVVLAGLGSPAPAERRGCTALPFRTVAVQPLCPRSSALLGALAVGAAVAKLRDDVADGDRPLVKRAVLRLLRRAAARADDVLVRLGFPLSVLVELPARQAAVEACDRPTLAQLAEPSAELCGQVFAHAAAVAGRLADALPLRDFGRALGGFVYALDAWRDLGDDVRLGRFNAWRAASPVAVLPCRVAAHLRDRLASARAAILRVDLGMHGAIVGALLDSLERTAAAVARAPTPVLSRDARQAGDCDVPCDGCCDLDCCGGASEAAAEGSSSCCTVHDTGCGCDVCDLCCWWSIGARERRTVRKARRARRRGRDFADVDLSGLVGADGTATTDLLPSGRIEVRGLAFDAVAETGMIDRGAAVTVTGAERGRLTVARRAR